MSMKLGPLISGVVAATALSAVVIAFTTGASPYVTIQQAKASRGDRLHLAGDIVKSTVQNDVYTQTLTFQVIDSNGDRIKVKHKGEKPANLSEATKVVAVGKIENGEFQSSELIVKCPSKYEAEKK